MIDSFDHSLAAFRRSFKEIELLNRLFGGISVVLERLGPMIRSERPGRPADTQPITVIDVCSGSADIPREIVKWGKRNSTRFAILSTDANSKALNVARERSEGIGDLAFLQCDAKALPFSDRSFDYATCSLALHHFDDGAAGVILRELGRVSRRGFIINDLRRAYLPALLIAAVTRILGMSRLTRHDAPLSVMRSRTLDEYRDLAERAGFNGAKVFAHPYWRAALVVETP